MHTSGTSNAEFATGSVKFDVKKERERELERGREREREGLTSPPLPPADLPRRDSRFKTITRAVKKRTKKIKKKMMESAFSSEDTDEEDDQQVADYEVGNNSANIGSPGESEGEDAIEMEKKSKEKKKRRKSEKIMVSMFFYRCSFSTILLTNCVSY